jgi:hypothetical protein
MLASTSGDKRASSLLHLSALEAIARRRGLDLSPRLSPGGFSEKSVAQIGPAKRNEKQGYE